MKNKILIILLLILTMMRANAKDGIEVAGDILEYALPAMALGSTFIWEDDSKPTWQFVKSYGTAVAVSFTLKRVINKERPDGGPHSFPSGHTTSAFSGAAFMERRYGWKVGVPAYATAAFVGYSRVHAERHDWWDVLGGAVLGTSTSYLFVKKYKKENLDISLNVLPELYTAGFVYRF